MQIYLIRHTKVDVPQGIFYGQTDVSLAESFNDEIKEIKKKLKNITPDVVYSSPLNRCRLLAEKIAENKEIIFDKRLLELNFGDWEMKSWNNLKGTTINNWFNNFVEAKCPGGESYVDLCKRVNLFYKDVSEKNCENVFIFTHSGVIRAFLSILGNIDLRNTFRTEIPYGQVLSYKI